MSDLLLYAGGALPMLWGAAHLSPTRQVVDGFGPITRENRLVLTMEWIAEAILLIFIGVLVVVATARFGADGAAPQTTFAAGRDAHRPRRRVGVHRRRVDFIMYRLCAPIFTLPAVLILAGALL